MTPKMSLTLTQTKIPICVSKISHVTLHRENPGYDRICLPPHPTAGQTRATVHQTHVTGDCFLQSIHPKLSKHCIIFEFRRLSWFSSENIGQQRTASISSGTFVMRQSSQFGIFSRAMNTPAIRSRSHSVI